MTPAKIFLPVICMFLSIILSAQIKAVTDTGDEVLLFTDGTWKYVIETKNTDSVTINPLVFFKPEAANFLLKSNRSKAGFWLNSKKWNFEKSTDNNIEYSFSLKENSSVGALVLSEQVSMELKSLRKFAIDNIQKASSKFTVIREEYRYVNGLKVLLLESDVVVQGIPIIYLNYYYSDSLSTVQLMSYAPKSLADKYRNAREELLNGLVITEENNSDLNIMQNKEAIQSSLVANSDCKSLFKGSWSYVANGIKYINKMVNNKVLESNIKNSNKSEYEIKWIDNCHYELKLLNSNDPATKLINKDAIISVEILEIDVEKMRYQLTYGKEHVSGEMTKEN